MSEDMNRDPLIDKLSRLTPASAGIDREAILFAAGRASANSGRRWKILTAALALTQTATLALWLSSSHSAQVDRGAITAPIEPRIEQREPPSSTPSQSIAESSYGEMRRWEKTGMPPPPVVTDPAPSQPILSIAAGRQVLSSD
jgi:hypothetical protein